jgi:hypothetical protein
LYPSMGSVPTPCGLRPVFEAGTPVDCDENGGNRRSRRNVRLRK